MAQVIHDSSDFTDINESSCSTCDEFEDEWSWDTDDEVEEANATDDMFKILEGDW
ncbi:hypothetical protein T440DRAFT_473748 [Plenodomus tracheiphilus IPT5]|uniref:Uncharacterized protein n=1 Tax=Plenodomus tracheiphilus IPT5 TaxID=1408161 RepID=A0A6A7AP96_9PLEO|nr:hypothetical protein T440DRAFT_473748 [Plenodomus tracheiphilus IPT5]